LNLTRYWRDGKSVFLIGVRDKDANLLCHGCHPKGTYSWEKLESDKDTDWWLGVIEGVCLLPFRVLAWLWRTCRPGRGRS
jgi:hypothetical protein